MKICHLTTVHKPEDIRIFVKECQSLAKAGHDVTLLVANGPTYEKYGVRIVGVPIEASNRLKRMANGIRAMIHAALALDADVYHFHDPELMIAGLSLTKHGKKVIYDVHEDVPEQVLSKHWIPGPLRKLVSVAVRRFEKYAASRFAAVVTATPTINARFKTYNRNAVTIHNYPILDELIDESIDLAAKPFDNGQIVYIGGISDLRGIREMVEAMKGLNEKRDATLLLAGPFLQAALEPEMKAHVGWQHVDYRGVIDREQVKNVLMESSVGLVLLHPEPRYVVSYPIKMFEYMSAGIPVVASNFPIWRDIVEGNDCGVCVDALKVDDIICAVNYLLENPDRAREMGMNGRKAIETIYNWEAESVRLVELYASLSR